jgi:hypothetical protein
VRGRENLVNSKTVAILQNTTGEFNSDNSISEIIHSEKSISRKDEKVEAVKKTSGLEG